ncbi:hypothetical protein [Nocardia sp. NBC_01730]|uniref:hypothetical protein n=1 Tax=Nocardia sp. NBC_01730 TaxID=2975998 RepID=UPI003FA3DB74
MSSLLPADGSRLLIGGKLLRDTTAPIDEGDFWLPVLRHVRDLGEKDLTLALELGVRLGTALPLAELALDRLGPGLGVGMPASSSPTAPSSEGSETCLMPAPFVRSAQAR